MRRGLDPRVLRLLRRAREAGRDTLLETEGMELLAMLGLGVPASFVVDGAAALEEEENRRRLEALPGRRAVVKALAPHVVHKTEAGGVAVVAKDAGAVASAVAAMQERFAGQEMAGYGVFRFVEHDRAPGGELLLGVRWTPDFGPVVSVGSGGTAAEFLAECLRPGREAAVLSPGLTPADRIGEVLEGAAVVPLALGEVRGLERRISREELVGIVRRLLEFADRFVPDEVHELEVNPLVLTQDGPVALDVLVRLGLGPADTAPPRPLAKLGALLRPRSVAVMGVSERRNPGRIIVENLLREGTEPDAVTIVKPGCEEIAGCRCVPSVDDLPERVDLLILSIAAAQVPEVVERVVAGRLAESIIAIPGGLGEREGSEGLAARVQKALHDARAEDWGGPVLNGGNSLGVRSRPGRYDTLFLPEHKLPPRREETTPLALVSQSGAFTVSKTSKLASVSPRYLVSVGNQLDLTVGDYMEYLAADEEVEVFAFYVEGFRPGDGRRWLEAAAPVAAGGRPVVLYRAGRTPEGARAGASHTAAVAGDWTVTRQLAREAGVLVAESVADFEDLVRLCCLLGGREVEGRRLAGLSNAGFESVALADSLGRFRLADLSPATRETLEGIIRESRLEGIVGVQNPMDVNPLMGDEPYEAACRALLDDPGVDVAVIGCVPMTGALETLPASPDHPEDLAREGSIVSRLARLHSESTKPWVAVVDAGWMYDPMARHLEERGVPTFRTADRALRLFGDWCGWRLRG